jgi:hypothetical protein
MSRARRFDNDVRSGKMVCGAGLALSRGETVGSVYPILSRCGVRPRILKESPSRSFLATVRMKAIRIRPDVELPQVARWREEHSSRFVTAGELNAAGDGSVEPNGSPG